MNCRIAVTTLSGVFSPALLVWVCAAVLPAAARAASGPPPPKQDAIVTLGANSAIVTLPAPTRYVVLFHQAAKVRTLHTRGAVLSHPKNPALSMTIERIDANSVLLRETRTKQTRFVRPGKPIPGFPDLVFRGTVVLDTVEYRSRVVGHLMHPDPVVVALEGSRALVEVEVLGSAPLERIAPSAPLEPIPSEASRHKLDKELFANVPVKEADPGTYEVQASSVQPVIENVGQVLADLQPMVAPALSLQSGLGFNLTSPVVDGTLGGSGFTVTNSKLAQRFGIEAGDVIKRINGHAVNSPLDAWMVYQDFATKNPLQSVVRVDLERHGVPMTKTYRLR